jgi:alkylated DNA repair dioxygenase AlkB
MMVPQQMNRRIDLGHQSFLELLPGFIAAGEAELLLACLQEELDWQSREIVLFGRRILQPRLVAWAGDLPYRYSGQTLPARAYTPAVADLCERVSVAAQERFNHVLANRYRDGNDSMGMHADAEPELGPDPVVATLSFGATRPLVIAPRKGLAGDKLAIPLGSGDLMVMRGACQRFFRHGIPRSRQPVGERISLTFRHIRKFALPGAERIVDGIAKPREP